MKKLYAIFFGTNGNGTTCQFITRVNEEQAKQYTEILPKQLGNGRFYVGETEIPKTEYSNVDMRQWTIPEWNAKISCKVFPVFE